DPMLGKLIAWGSDRGEAIARLERALGEYYASGIKTNVGLFRKILATEDFRKGEIYTRWLDDYLKQAPKSAVAAADGPLSREERAAILAAALWQQSRAGDATAANSEPVANTAPANSSRWKAEGRREQVDREPGR